MDDSGVSWRIIAAQSRAILNNKLTDPQPPTLLNLVGMNNPFTQDGGESLVDKWMRFDTGIYSHFKIERVFLPENMTNGTHGHIPYIGFTVPRLRVRYI